MENRSSNKSARESILQSIRSNLAASAPHDLKESGIHHAFDAPLKALASFGQDGSLVDLFKASLEAVDGKCLIVQNESELVQKLTEIIVRLRGTQLRARRIALSDAPELEGLVNQLEIEFDEVALTPSASEVFNFDVGISRAQAGIAETGTLLLDSSRERHRLVSLVPPVHIAIVDANQIVATLGEALVLMRKENQVSSIVTLVTGPSRTADIELTLAIGVHGPQELYVIIRR